VASARQTEANRRNARKSTGPVTPEGKRASSRNALKHGLRARTHVPRDDAAEAADRAARWNSALRPYTAFEVWLADQVALESVRVERCQALERDTRARAAARASARWDEDRRLDAERDALLLAAAPALTVLQLRRTPQGCDWLAARWSELAESLRQGRDWDDARRSLALDLLGVPPQFRDGPTPLDAAVSRDDRAALAEARADELRRLKARVLDPLDAADHAAAALGSPAEPDAPTRTARRYEATRARQLRWALAQLKSPRAALPSIALPTGSFDPSASLPPFTPARPTGGDR